MHPQIQNDHGLEANATASPPPAIPDYELLRCIGRGAYGEVWLASNLTGSFVAVKVVRKAAFDHERPFEREFEGIKRFEPISRSDPSQVPILHVGRGEGFFYYVMELADAFTKPKPEDSHPKFETSERPQVWSPNDYVPHTLREDLKQQGHLPVEQCVQIGQALTRALAHLHTCGLVHRDVKPSNVIFAGGVPKLADIGLVTSIDATRSLVGTEGYVAPEGPGTPQADLYSLGKLLYEMSTGCDRKEFPSLPADVTTRSDRNALIELNAIITRACQFDPRERHGNAEAILSELEVLRRGHSVNRQRRLKQWTNAGGKAAIILSCVAALALTAHLLGRRTSTSDADADGPPSTNMEANAICVKALGLLRADAIDKFPQVYANLHRAADLDTNFAKPYIGLLELRLRQYDPGPGKAPPDEIGIITERLSKLAPRHSATLCAQAITNWSHGDFSRAEECALDAIEAGPNYELAHTFYAWMLTMWGRPKEARPLLEKSLALRSGKALIYGCMGQTYHVERDYQKAIAWQRQAFALESNHFSSFLYIGLAEQARGDYVSAITNFEQFDLRDRKDPDVTKTRYAALLRAFNDRGEIGYWQERRRQAEESRNEDLYQRAVIQIHLGKTNEALDKLEQALEIEKGRIGDSDLKNLIFDGSWYSLRNNDRFKRLLNKVGFTTKVTQPRK